MNIRVTNIKINVIATVGSFNIGKTIICQNRSYTQDVTPVPPAQPFGPPFAPGRVPTQPTLPHVIPPVPPTPR